MKLMKTFKDKPTSLELIDKQQGTVIYSQMVSGMLKIRSLKIQTLFQGKVLPLVTQCFRQTIGGKIIHYPLCVLYINTYTFQKEKLTKETKVFI